MASRSKIAVTLLGLYFGTFCYNVYAADTKVKYSADNVTYDKIKKKTVLQGNVKITVDEVDITGEEIDVDLIEKVVSTDKPFKIHTIKEGKTTDMDGKSFNFNIDTKRLIAKYSSLETDADSPGQKVYISGEEITLYNKGERVSVVNGDFTTCDYIEKGLTPHYSLKASQMDFIPNDRVVAWNTSVYTGGNKVYWYPVWYIPLRSDKQSLNADIGKNETEGTFINFRGYYNLNDYHDGNWFARVMEKKYFGLGFEHTWLALPTSQTYLFAYGNPINARYFAEPNADYKKNISTFFEDKEVYLEHTQWLPFLPYAQTTFSTHYRDFYNIGSLSTISRDDFNQYNLRFSDSEIYQPFKDTILRFLPTFTANYEQRRNPVLNNSSKIVPTQVNNVLNLTTDNSFNINDDISLRLNGTLNNTIGQTLFNPTTVPVATGQTPPQQLTAENTVTNNVLNYFKSTDNVDLSTNLTMNYKIFPSLNFTGTTAFFNTDSRNFNQPTSITLPPLQTSSDTLTQKLNSTASLVQSLGWGDLTLLADHHYDFLENDLFPRDNLGNIVADSKLSTEQKDKQAKALAKRRGQGYINKLPELNLNLNPFFTDTVPIRLSTSIGRYLESTTYSLTNISTKITDLVRSEVKLNLDSKEYDFGLGNKFNFGGTGYQQDFYQTQDAQYQITGQLNYKNDFFSFLTPNLSYSKVITDDQNNSPFSFDRSSRNKQDVLRTGVSLGNIPAFTMNLTNFGYDYQNKNYFDPSLSVNSDFVAGARFNLNLNTSYRLNNIRKESLTKTNTYLSRAQLQLDVANSTFNDTEFAKKYVGYSKQQAQSDLNTIKDDNALKTKYGIDNRLYDVTGKDLIGNTALTEADIGKLELRGGRLNPISLTFGVGTPWDFDQQTDYGKETGIPWGLAGLLTTSIDPQSEDFYKPKTINGIKQTLKADQTSANFLQKFSNSSLDFLFVIGGSWYTHTRIEAGLTFIPPELLADGVISLQNNRPSFPFNTSLSIKKDLHDFILSVDLQNEYVPANNRNNFSFAVNLELTAFPFSTKDLTNQAQSGLGSVTSNLNQVTR